MTDISSEILNLLQINSVLGIINLLQGVVFGIVFISISSTKKPSFYLGMFLFFWGFRFAGDILADLGYIIEYPFMIFLPLNFYFLSFPLLFLYIKGLTGQYDYNKDKKHLIPGLLEFVLFSILFITFLVNRKLGTDGTFHYSFILFYLLSSHLFAAYYLIKMRSLIRMHKVKVLEVFSSTDKKLLSWLIPMIYIFLLSTCLAFMFTLFQIAFEQVDFLAGKYFIYVYIALSILDIILTYWVVIYGIKQSVIWPKAFVDKSLNQNSTEKPGNEISNFDELFEKVILTVEDTKCFKNNELTIADLARLTNIHPAKLSRVIKQKTKTNFSSFVNKYRIEEAKLIMKDSARLKMFSFNIVIQEVGFKSTSAFYRAFKKFEGITPTHYLMKYEAEKS